MDARPALKKGGLPPVSHVHLNGTTISPRQLRRYPRASVSWPVVMEAGRRIFLLQAVNVSGRGAKVRPTERPGESHVGRLHFHPPNGSALYVRAVVCGVTR